MSLITPQQIYWLTRCDAIKAFTNTSGACIVLLVILILTLYGLSFIVQNELDWNDDTIKKVAMPTRRVMVKISIALVVWHILCVVVHPFVPSTKEMAAIIVVPRIANSQSVQELGSDIVTLAKDWLSELHPKKEANNE